MGDSQKPAQPLDSLPRQAEVAPCFDLSQPKRLGDILVERGLINEQQRDEAIQIQKDTGEYLGQIIVSKNWVADSKMLEILSEQLESFGPLEIDDQEEPIDEESLVIEADAIKLVPLELAIKANAVPISIREVEKKLQLGVVDTKDLTALDEIHFKTGLVPEPVVVSAYFIESAWKKFYNYNAISSVSKQNDLLQSEFRAFTSKLTQEQVNPFISRLLSKAAELGASDIHIDLFKHEVKIRFRIDGQLYQVTSFKKEFYSQFIGRMKVLANIDVADRQATYDGRVSFKTADGLQREYRISILQSLFGERVVLRVQRDNSHIPRLDSINLPKVYIEKVRSKVKLPHGMIVVTGPTGSGKTTTLYAMLSELADYTRNIMTIEDPVELTLAGASQIPVGADRELSFSSALRSALRQDPDVIMIGEIRDEETAQIAVRAAMTGHLVLCSLHTNDALSAITRLEDMNVPPYYIGPALNLLVAQRLIRLLCDECKQKGSYSRQMLLELGFSPAQIRSLNLYSAKGCSKCNMTGYRGRIPIFEMVDVRARLREAIAKSEPMRRLMSIAKKSDYVPFGTLLREYIKRGKTSVEEALPYLLDQ